MNIDIKKVKIIVTVPEDFTEKVRNAMCEAGAGVIGNYTYCSTSVKSIGTFIPNENSNAYIGAKNILTYVNEDRLEVICDIEKVKLVLNKIREVHPYEEPAIDIIPLIDELSLI